MEHIDKQKFVALMNALAAAHAKDATKALLHGYWLGLRDLPIEEVERACGRALTECEFFPKPVELRRLGGEMDDSSRAVIAWAVVAKAVGERGAYSSVQFDDPVINATIRNLGGWEKLCATEVEEFGKWVRKDFERIYKALSSAPLTEQAAAYLPGITERSNGARGYQTPEPQKITTGLLPARLAASLISERTGEP